MLFVSFYFYLFIFGCAGYSLLHGFCSSCERESYSVVLVLRLLVAVASLVGAHGLGAHGLHCWGARAQLPHHTWDPPGPGIKPMSLVEGFFTTEPPSEAQQRS